MVSRIRGYLETHTEQFSLSDAQNKNVLRTPHRDGGNEGQGE